MVVFPPRLPARVLRVPTSTTWMEWLRGASRWLPFGVRFRRHYHRWYAHGAVLAVLSRVCVGLCVTFCVCAGARRAYLLCVGLAAGLGAVADYASMTALNIAIHSSVGSASGLWGVQFEARPWQVVHLVSKVRLAAHRLPVAHRPSLYSVWSRWDSCSALKVARHVSTTGLLGRRRLPSRCFLPGLDRPEGAKAAPL